MIKSYSNYNDYLVECIDKSIDYSEYLGKSNRHYRLIGILNKINKTK
jgi:hypothetical protein